MTRAGFIFATTALSVVLRTPSLVASPQNPPAKTSQPSTQKLPNPLNDLLDEA